MKRNHPDGVSPSPPLGYIVEDEASRMGRPMRWRDQNPGHDGPVYFVTVSSPQKGVDHNSYREENTKQRRPRHRRVRFAEEHNRAYYDFQPTRNSQERRQSWYTNQDYARFAQETKQLADQLNDDDHHDQNDGNNKSCWADSLLRIYDAFHNAQNTEEIKPILLAHHVSLPNDDWVGMEKVAIPTVGQISLEHRLRLWQRVNSVQNTLAMFHVHERERWIRHAVERHSYVSLMFARYMAFLIAESRDTEESTCYL